MNHNALVSLEAAPTSAGQADAEVIDLEPIGSEHLPAAEPLQEQLLGLSDFIEFFGEGLLDAVQQQNPPVYSGVHRPEWEAILAGLSRRPFVEQANVVHAVAQLLLDAGKPAAVINGEMGTGKTMMGIAAATILHHAGLPRCLVIAPPHLVYKWRREIIQTVPKARVWVLNGADTLRKLLAMREALGKGAPKPEAPEFFVLGRVRMRMGFNWRPAYMTRLQGVGEGDHFQALRLVACTSCGTPVMDDEGVPLQTHAAEAFLGRRRSRCRHCDESLWTLTRGTVAAKSLRDQVRDALVQIPSIGDVRARRLIDSFGEDMLAEMLGDNIHNFINLMDDEGELIFNDRQATRMERFLGNTEVSFGQGGYQPTEFIKRYLPKKYFGCLLVDEGHEYKNDGSAQGQAMGVLASQVEKAILLTGTLMGGYADDLFHLLYRLDPASMIEDGFNYNKRGSIGPAADAFMRAHGVVIETYKVSSSSERKSHRTARGETITRHTSRGPGFGPKGIMRYVVPITAFLKLKDIGANVLPAYAEEYIEVPMDVEQAQIYRRLSGKLKEVLRVSLLAGDHSLLGVVLNVLLAWPDCAFRDELVYHPHRRTLLASAPKLYGDHDLMPKEREVIALCRAERQAGRRVLLYTTYTGTRDTMARLKFHLDQAGFKVAVLRSTVEASKREDWLADQVERGVDVVITNPELVKTGLDMLEFPTIGFLQTGYNVYTLQQAARRSWRIGQTKPVRVVFFGYAGTAQTECLTLMAKKIAVAQSTSGDMPESGLDILNQDGDSIEVALAKQLVEVD